MAIFKCKMCGGDLDVAEGVTIAECDYCGTKQTVPKVMDENLQNLFNRANTLRMKSEFDKAEKLYEKIIQADSTQSEAYWGLILCKYGIEYVDDPKTYKKIPTCHRASYDSIIADDDYKSAIENADMSQRILYEEQAKEIDRIQKDILALAQKEESYDVFICYKETDADGRRTQDSVIANDIYYQLTQEGFKVFYAAITLEGKLGSAYEPIIFAALNSAKVMLVIGTKPEYFNAVWVKNEWSRYLKVIQKDRSKLLIPCYRDMDAYELPEEFAHLQAQDMSKIGFINDIVRGIKKVIKKDEPKPQTVVKETVVTAGAATNTAPLLERAFMFLEDQKWEDANAYCEKVLDIEPKNAQAYLGKLLAELKITSKKNLAYASKPFDSSDNYKKIVRFGDDVLKNELKQYNEKIRERNEEERKANIYKTGVELANSQIPKKLIEAAQTFDKIPGYRDADEKAKHCRQKALEMQYNEALGLFNKANTANDFKEIGKIFMMMGNYPPAMEKADECLLKARELVEVERKDKIYNEALAAYNKNDIPAIEDAIKKFKSIISWKDSEQKIEACKQKIATIQKRNEEAKIAAQKRKKRALIISLASVFAVIVLTISFFILEPTVSKKIHMANGDYAKIVQRYELTEFEIPEGTTTIKANAFANCTTLKSITIPDSVTTIERYAFANCSSLKTLVIPNSVKFIGYKALSGCDKLETITIPSVDIIEKDTSCDGAQFSYLFNKTSYKYEGETRWYYAEPTSLTTVIITNDTIVEGCRAIGLFVKNIVLMEGTQRIGDYAFYSSSITNITIPNGVTSIGKYAFYSTNLTSITLPNTLTFIGDGAFMFCDFTEITIPDGVTSIGEGVFQYCHKLTNVDIPSSVTIIGKDAFYGCDNLTSITIPNSVTSIGDSAFNSCKKLETVYFMGTEDEWEAISFGRDNDTTLKSVNIVFGKKTDYSEAKLGDTIKLGNLDEQRIEWLVLDVQNDKALVISKYALVSHQYDPQGSLVTWENCSLRQWLNNDFLNSLFSESEQSMIITTTIPADEFDFFLSQPPNPTQDKLFLLNIDEVEKYFSDDDSRQCSPTKYATKHGVTLDTTGQYCSWLLRTPIHKSYNDTYVVYVKVTGKINTAGVTSVAYGYGIRPAMWIDLNA